MRQIELLDEPLHGCGAFHGIQVFTLEVLDEGPFRCDLIVNVVNNDRGFRPLQERQSAKAPFASDEFKALAFRPHNQGLHQAGGLDGVCQLPDLFLVEHLARLPGIPGDRCNGHHSVRRAGLGLLAGRVRRSNGWRQPLNSRHCRHGALAP